MEAQAEYLCELDRPAVATLTGQPPAMACATCRGTGAMGRTHKFMPIGGHTLVTTHTTWCQTCKGVGLVWREAP